MTRKEQVHQVVKEYTLGISLKDLQGTNRLGLDASTIGHMINAQRNNVSKELNLLVKEGKLFRKHGKPVLYLDLKVLEQKLGRCITESEKSKAAIEAFAGNGLCRPDPGRKIWPGSLDGLIGGKGSLKKQVEQAKAAVLYPPRGLNVFLVGPTGVGKTMFAEMMHQFAVQSGRLAPEAPFIIFNCADYAENPQLLISQLFGHVKGAYTGAEKDKPGLLEKADGGILLLDEVHRLPAEGQEKLFHFIDQGIYRRLGETEAGRKAAVLIIAATTEDPASYLLRTFIRRIPVVIEIPPLSKRPFEERLRLIKKFFREEAKKVNTLISITPETIHSLLLYNCTGNVGQLKADIQLLCARAFFEFKTTRQENLKIKFAMLSDHIKEALLSGDYRDNLQELKRNTAVEIKIRPEEDHPSLTQYYPALQYFYRQLESRLQKYISSFNLNLEPPFPLEQVAAEALQDFWAKIEVENPAGSIFPREVWEDCLEINLLEAVDAAFAQTKAKLKKLPDRQLLYLFCLHVKFNLDQPARKAAVPALKQITFTPEELEQAEVINGVLGGLLGEGQHFLDPRFTALCLKINRHYGLPQEPPVGILVIAHGSSTATSMLEVAQNILNTQGGKAIDMPLDIEINAFLEEVCEAVRAIDRGKGVLMLVDMGSLLTLAEVVTKRTGIATKTMEMVSTPMVMQALEKASLPGMNLEKLGRELESINPYYAVPALRWDRSSNFSAKILVTCITGHGTAVKLAELLSSLEVIREQNLEVIPVNRYEENDDFAGEHILAVVGTIDLKLPGVPFISMEEIVTGAGLAKICAATKRREQSIEIQMEQGFEEVVISALNRFLEFTSPLKIFHHLNYAVKYIEEQGAFKFTANIYLRFMIHCGCMVERVLRGNCLAFKKHKSVLKANKALYVVLREGFKLLEEGFSLIIPAEEYAYVIELLLDSFPQCVSLPG